ncbi:hypothetical protein JTE90_029159 [Oedothorax gibbosus]|uniref:ARMC5-like ARM-repeats domain-containing protein n=1 Tax=Oedothorax gibbosus TaxID=931172 RepID=A0AAV6VGM5_9ARAC|nr:hypothetical protein JTE90_029159 [Oedothorax gibbosus]
MDRTVNEDIRNRACRALGNIANSKIGLEAVYSVQPIPVNLSFLSGTENVNCQQTAARTLRILAKDHKSRDFIIQENGIGLVCNLLHSKSKDVIKCSIRALAELTENCNIHSARQVKERHVLKILVELYSFSNKDIKEHILAILKNLSAIEEIRYDLLKIGALKIFAEACMGSVSSESSRHAVLALCCLLDRLHIWEGNGVTKKGGLKAVLEILRQSTFEDIHKQILIALYPHCYEPNIPDILFEQEIIEILLQVLKRFIACNKDGHSNPALEYFHLQVPSEVDGELSRNSLTSYNSEEDLSLEEKSYENSNFPSFSDSISKFPFIQPYPNPIKSFPNYNSSSHLNLHSSGAESNCSPCSSRSNNPRSPSIYSDSEVSSPLIDPWSPQSIVNANECLSPVFSCSEDSCDDNNFKKVDEKYVQLSSLTRTEKTTTNDIYDSITVCSPKSCQSAAVVISIQDNKSDALFTPIRKDKDESGGFEEFHDVEPLSSILSCSEDTSDDDDWIVVDDYIYPNSTNVTLTHETSVCDSVVCSSSTSDPNLDSKSAKECDTSSATQILVDDDILPISINVTPIHAKSVCDLAVCVPSTSQDTAITDSKSAQKCNKLSTEIYKDSNLSYTKKESVKIEAMHSPKDLSPTVKRKADVDIIGIPIKKIKISSAPNVSHKLEMFAEKCTLDHCVLLFLDQLSFHLEKKTNSQIASRSCFSVLMDYIVSINNPNPKAEKILLNLVKNRYCFEKLIMSGFVADMDKIMIVNHSLKNCIRCSNLKEHISASKASVLGQIRGLTVQKCCGAGNPHLEEF